jgi:hypothetical protein
MTTTTPTSPDAMRDVHDRDARSGDQHGTRAVPPRVSLVDRTLMHVGLALLLLGERRAAAPRPAERPRIDTAGRPTAEIFRQFC